MVCSSIFCYWLLRLICLIRLWNQVKHLFAGGFSSPYGNNDEYHEKFQAIKGAPTGSLFSQFCLHALWFGSCNIRGNDNELCTRIKENKLWVYNAHSNICLLIFSWLSAISILWIEFVREVSWCWEELQPLPRITPDDNIDFSTCLIHQKLQLVCFNEIVC